MSNALFHADQSLFAAASAAVEVVRSGSGRDGRQESAGECVLSLSHCAIHHAELPQHDPGSTRGQRCSHPGDSIWKDFFFWSYSVQFNIIYCMRVIFFFLKEMFDDDWRRTRTEM